MNLQRSIGTRPRRAAASIAAGLGVVVAASVIPGSVLAQGPALNDQTGRFTLVPAPDEQGFMRIDKVTGAVSLCSRIDNEWACRALADDQKSLQERIARLEQENKSLREENRRLEDVMGLNPEAKPGTNGAPDAGPPGRGNNFKLPTEKDVDQAFDYFEGMLKKFRDRLKKLEEQDKKSEGVPL